MKELRCQLRCRLVEFPVHMRLQFGLRLWFCGRICKRCSTNLIVSFLRVDAKSFSHTSPLSTFVLDIRKCITNALIFPILACRPNNSVLTSLHNSKRGRDNCHLFRLFGSQQYEGHCSNTFWLRFQLL